MRLSTTARSCSRVRLAIWDWVRSSSARRSRSTAATTTGSTGWSTGILPPDSHREVGRLAVGIKRGQRWVERDFARVDLGHGTGTDPGRRQAAHDPALPVHALLLEQED